MYWASFKYMLHYLYHFGCKYYLKRKSVYLSLSMSNLLFQVMQLVLLYHTFLLGFLEQDPLIIYSPEELFLTLQDGEEGNIDALL